MQSGEGKLYTGRFFDSVAEGSIRSARKIVPIVMQLVAPNSVLDVGCGTGGWLRVFADLGISDYLGIDGDYVDRTALSIPQDRFQSRDLKEPFDLGRKFDLAISMEVGEHLPPTRAASFVASITQHAPIVLFSAAIPLQGGTGHLNEQFQSYWIDQFSRVNFEAIDCIRRRVWRDPQVLPWYSQNAMLFVRRDAITPALARERDDPKNAMEPDVVHPGVLVNSLSYNDIKLRTELTQPTREQRALAANVPNWLRDGQLNSLKKARGELALMFLESPAEQLPVMFAGPLGQTYRQLMQSNLRYEAFSEAERAFVASTFPPTPIVWKDASAAGKFLGASLYHLPHRLPVMFDRANAPKWLFEDVANYLTAPLLRFADASDADAYALFAKQLFDQIESFLKVEPDIELRHRVGARVAIPAHGPALAQSQSPAAREAEQTRLRIIQLLK